MKSIRHNVGPGPSIKPSYFWRVLPALLMVVLFLAAPEPKLWAEQRAQIPLDVARIIIEFNSSANDVGVQVSVDGESWRRLSLESPDGHDILDINASGSLKKQGLTELFFESSEPSLDELPLAEFLARFPEGQYEFEGRTIEGDRLTGEGAFTHVIPAGPMILTPGTGSPVGLDAVVISWQAVTQKIAGSGPLVIVGYQVVVDGGNPSRRFDVTLPSGTTSVRVPPEFLEPGTPYAFEVLAIETGGNQTITEGAFVTAGS